MSKFPPRRFICNFVDGTAEFNDDATPPAQEYVSIVEYDDALASKSAEVEELDASIESMMVLRAKWQHQLLTAESALSESQARVKQLEDALEDLKLCTTQGLRYPGTETLESLNSKCRKALAAILGGSDG